jgi:hypothetical protein
MFAWTGCKYGPWGSRVLRNFSEVRGQPNRWRADVIIHSKTQQSRKTQRATPSCYRNSVSTRGNTYSCSLIAFIVFESGNWDTCNFQAGFASCVYGFSREQCSQLSEVRALRSNSHFSWRHADGVARCGLTLLPCWRFHSQCIMKRPLPIHCPCPFLSSFISFVSCSSLLSCL